MAGAPALIMIGEDKLEQRQSASQATARSLQSLDHPLVWWFCFSVVAAIGGSSFSIDGNSDLGNYHLYNGFSAFHDRRALDIFPAQLQTTLFYGLDAAYYLIFSSLNDRPASYKSPIFDSLLGRGACDLSHCPSVREAQFSLACPH